MNPRSILALLAAASLWSACGDDAAAGGKVTLYIALDEEHSKRFVKMFEERSGIAVNANYDTESQKTVGLVSQINEEAGAPRCDVFWNNELAHTVALMDKGLLAPYASPAASAIPSQFKDPGNHWTGFAARARILIVNTELIPDPADYPKSMWDLLDPKWKDKCGVAKPLTGTTLTHFTALKTVLSAADFDRFVNGIKENAVILQSNGATMREVRSGNLAWAFTDTDDFNVAQERGYPVACVFPDQGDDQIGTMLIPNSVAIIKRGPNPEQAEKLVDFIVSEEIEGLLAAARSAQIPVRASVPGPKVNGVKAIGQFKAMTWDPSQTAKRLADMTQFFAKLYGM